MDAIRVDEDTALIPTTSGQAALLFAIVDANRAYLKTWFPWIAQSVTVNDTVAFLETSERARSAGLAYEFLIEHRGDFCGVVGLNQIDKVNRAANCGYWIAEHHQGRGLVTTGCRVLLDFGFDAVGLNRVSVATATENHRSRRVAERLGFSYEGTFREVEWLNNRFVDHARYALLRRDWERDAC